MTHKIEAKKYDSIMRDLDGISARTMTEHYKLYQGYVNKYNEIMGKIDGADRGSANQTFSEIRSLKVDLTFAIGGVKNHELYFGHLGGKGGTPPSEIKQLLEKNFGSVEQWMADLKATGMASRGWAWTALGPRLGLPVQLRRRCAEQLSGLERGTDRRARRLRARLLPRLRHGPGQLHRYVLQERRVERRRREPGTRPRRQNYARVTLWDSLSPTESRASARLRAIVVQARSA